MPESAFAATWRDESGRTVATVYGGTACRAPRQPRDLAAATDDGGFESILRCRNCEGCRKYEELELRRRLASEITDAAAGLPRSASADRAAKKDYDPL